MKKTVFISIGVILIIIIAVWVYLFIFGKPENSDEIFARFGLGERETDTVVIPNTTVDVEETMQNGSPQKLKQLTTRPVGGAAFTTDGIRYMEKGTGHIYQIDLTTGEETLISGTTIPQSAEAVFSKDTSLVAVTTHGQIGNKTTIQKLTGQSGTSSPTGIALPIGAHEIAFSNATNTVLYILKEHDGAAGYTYNMVTKKGSQLFKIALKDVRVLWGDPVYVYTTPTYLQEGYMYRLSGNTLEYVANGGHGLTGIRYTGGIIETVVTEDNGVVSTAYMKDAQPMNLPVPFLPEKCSAQAENFIYCATPTNIPQGEFPDNWYKGTVSLSDTLWKVDVSTSGVSLVSDFRSESGREIDVVQIGINADGTKVYFINKNDDTLWMFDTTS